MINKIEDKNVLKFLGSKRLAMGRKGFYSTNENMEFYIIVAGNGTIIQIHDCTYVVTVIKERRVPIGKYGSENAYIKIYLYDAKKTHTEAEEENWFKKGFANIEAEFSK